MPAIAQGMAVTFTPPPFRPTFLSGCILWLRADRGVTVTGAGVSEWQDQSGNGHHATQTTDADRPALNTTGWASNGRPTIDFDVANTEYLNVSGFSETVESYTVHAVLDPTTSPSTAAILSSLGTGGSPGIFYQNASGNVIFFDVDVRADGASNTNAQTITWVLDGAGNTVSFYRNGTFQSTVACVGNTRLSGDTRIGMYFGGGQNLDAKLAEIAVYNRVLSATELMRVHSYTTSRYVIT